MSGVSKQFEHYAKICVLLVLVIYQVDCDRNHDPSNREDAGEPERDQKSQEPERGPRSQEPERGQRSQEPDRNPGQSEMNNLMAEGGADPNAFQLPSMSANESTVPDQWSFNPLQNFSPDIETNKSRDLDSLQSGGLSGIFSMFSEGGSNLVNKLSNNVTSGFGRAAMRSGANSLGNGAPPAATFAATLPEAPGIASKPGQPGPSIAMAMGVPKDLLSGTSSTSGMNRFSQMISKPQSATPFALFQRNRGS